MDGLNLLRNRSFPRVVALAAVLGLALASRVSAADSDTDATRAAVLRANAAAMNAADSPAFAGRVDPATYRIGPGDEFAYRSSDLLDPKVLRVGPTGMLLVPDVGPVPAAGMTLADLEARVRVLLRPYVRGKGLVFTLHRPRRFLATVVGDVVRPGAVEVQAPVRVSDVVEGAGGILPGGARRGILVRRESDSLWADLVRFERTGDLGSNPYVFDTDVVVVPTSTWRVDVAGAVAHPGWYDLMPGDRVSSVVAAAGGVLPQAALDAAERSRAVGPGRSETVPVRLEAALAQPGGADDPTLDGGDRLFIPETAHWRETASVVITGEVRRPGPYSIQDGIDRIQSVIERAGGTTEWADPGAIQIEREPNAAARDSAFLRLAREQAGALSEDERAYLLATTRERLALTVRMGSSPGSGTPRPDLPLLNRDRIVVPRRSLTVLVQGEVRSPGHVAYESGRTVSGYIDAAGGATSRARRGRVRVTLASTGRPVGASDVRTVQPGDVIWVPAKEPRSFWSSFKEGLTTMAQAATIYLVVREATK